MKAGDKQAPGHTRAGPRKPASSLAARPHPTAVSRASDDAPAALAHGRRAGGGASAQAPLRVLGIDPGTLRLGYGIVEAEGRARMRYVECGLITAPASRARGQRLAEIGRGLRELMAEMKPDVVAMEEAFFGLNVQSTIALGEARGVAIFVASEIGLDIAGYPPATIKQAVTGNGQADKDQMARVVRTLLAMRRTPSADAADALAIAICHGRRALLRDRLPPDKRETGRGRPRARRA